MDETTSETLPGTGAVSLRLCECPQCDEYGEVGPCIDRFGSVIWMCDACDAVWARPQDVERRRPVVEAYGMVADLFADDGRAVDQDSLRPALLAEVPPQWWISLPAPPVFSARSVSVVLSMLTSLTIQRQYPDFNWDRVASLMEDGRRREALDEVERQLANLSGAAPGSGPLDDVDPYIVAYLTELRRAVDAGSEEIAPGWRAVDDGDRVVIGGGAQSGPGSSGGEEAM